MKQNRQLAGHLAALVTACVWGMTFISTKVLLETFTPIEILFYRFTLGFVTLNLVYPKRMGRTTWRQELLFAGAGLTGVTLYFLMENIALTYTAASNVGVIVAVAPVFTALLAWWLLDGERPRLPFFLGFLLAISGIALISFSGSRLQLSPVGDILAVTSALAWSIYSIMTRKISAWGFHIVQSTRRIFLYGLIFMIPALILMDFRLGPERLAEPVNALNLLFLGLGASAGCFLTWNFSVGRLGPVKTSVYIYLVPVVTVVASVLILGEVITWLSAAGTALTLCGLIVSERKPRLPGGREKAMQIEEE